MAESQRFRRLRTNLTALRRELLPKRFSPTGVYSERELTRAVAYRVLAHAEFEGYLEDRATEVALTALRSWKATAAAGRVLVALAAFSDRQSDSIPELLVPSQSNQQAKWSDRIELSRRIDQASECFFQAVKENHGIKEPNLLRLLLPLGFPHSSLDATWLADMNSFGEKRGVAAHTSRVRQQLDPQQEYGTVRALLAGLKEIDERLALLT